MDSCEIKPEEIFCEKCLIHFRELIEKCPKVFGNGLFPKKERDEMKKIGLDAYFDWNESPDDCDTHQARLIMIEKLK